MGFHALKSWWSRLWYFTSLCSQQPVVSVIHGILRAAQRHKAIFQTECPVATSLSPGPNPVCCKSSSSGPVESTVCLGWLCAEGSSAPVQSPVAPSTPMSGLWPVLCFVPLSIPHHRWVSFQELRLGELALLCLLTGFCAQRRISVQA